MPVCAYRLLLACAVLAPLHAMQAWPRLAGPLDGNAWAVADFDGDGRLDVLTSTIEPGGAAGSRGRFDMASGSGARVLSMFQLGDGRGALNLIALDVDGDHDLDLVATAVLSNQTIAVWINDGHGAFTEGRLSDYAAARWPTALESLNQPGDPFPRLSVPMRGGTMDALARPCAREWLPGARSLRPSPARTVARRSAFLPSSPRAPPALA